MVVCKNCAGQSPDGASTCVHCGSRLVPYTPEEARAYVESLQADTASTHSETKKRAPAQRNNKGLGVVACVVGAIVLAVGLAALVAPETPSQPTPSSAPVVPVVTMTAEALSSAYDANEVAADAQYADRLVRVIGVVESISKDIFGKPFVMLDGVRGGIHCTFDSVYEPQLARLSKGQIVTVQGQVNSCILGSVMVDECTLVR